jgi:plastocyanin
VTAVRISIVGIAIVGFGVASIGCAGGGSEGATIGGATATVAVAPTVATSPSSAGQVIDIVAKDRVFSLTEIEVAAGSPFEIRFDNEDPYLHGIYIIKGVRPPHLTFEEAQALPTLFKGEFITGPATITYRVAGLAAGTYQFFCPIHEPQIGTLLVR